MYLAVSLLIGVLYPNLAYERLPDGSYLVVSGEADRRSGRGLGHPVPLEQWDSQLLEEVQDIWIDWGRASDGVLQIGESDLLLSLLAHYPLEDRQAQPLYLAAEAGDQVRVDLLIDSRYPNE